MSHIDDITNMEFKCPRCGTPMSAQTHGLHHLNTGFADLKEEANRDSAKFDIYIFCERCRDADDVYISITGKFDVWKSKDHPT